MKRFKNLVNYFLYCSYQFPSIRNFLLEMASNIQIIPMPKLSLEKTHLFQKEVNKNIFHCHY